MGGEWLTCYLWTGLFVDLTLAGLRGIVVTLKPRGGGGMALQVIGLHELAQMFSMFDLFFPYIVHCIRKIMPQKLGNYLYF